MDKSEIPPLTPAQKDVIGNRSSRGSQLEIHDIPVGSVLLVRHFKGTPTWFEVVEPEPTNRLAWDTGL